MIETLQALPFLTASALLAYLSLTLYLLSSRFKNWFNNAFAPPISSSGLDLPAFDVLRGLAALWVASFHYWQWNQPFFNELQWPLDIFTNGAKAVGVFVIMSGFLVYQTLLYRPLDETGLKNYFLRRAVRILPLYWASLLLIYVFGLIPSHTWNWQTLTAEVFMLRSFFRVPFTNPVAWSLYVEVLFYLILPAWVVLTKKHPKTFSVAAILVLLSVTNHSYREYRLFKYFFVGLLVSELYEYFKTRKLAQPVYLVSILAGAGLLYADIVHNVLWLEPKGYYDFTLILGIGTALLLLGLLHFQPAQRWLSLKLFRFLGVISYSVFLLHPLLLTVNTSLSFDGYGGLIGRPYLIKTEGYALYLGVYLPALIFVSAVSYLLIEKTAREIYRQRY